MFAYLTRWRETFSALSLKARLLLLVLFLFKVIAILTVLYIGPAALFQHIVTFAQWLAHQPHGRLIVLAIIILVSFPPMIGFSNSITLCGLAFGSKAGASKALPQGHTLLEGFSLAVTGVMLGSSLSFLVLRLINRHFRKARWLKEFKESQKWKAMGKAIKQKGFSMILLIRVCPFPFVYSNLFFASLDSVSFLYFFLATLFSTPRLFLHVYIGRVAYEFMDQTERNDLPLHAKVIDGLGVGAGMLLGAGVGWYLYRQVNKIIREDEDGAGDELDPLREAGAEEDEDLDRDVEERQHRRPIRTRAEVVYDQKRTL